MNEKGEYHRLDGPAVELSARYGYRPQWWINGYLVDNEIHEWAKERDIDLNNLSDLDKAIIALEWGKI
jgi:hypothetical protein